MVNILYASCLYLIRMFISPASHSRYSGLEDTAIVCRSLDNYSSFGTWWHTVTHGRGSEGETGEWSG